MEYFRERKKNRLLWNILGNKKKSSIHVLLIVHRMESITFSLFFEQARRKKLKCIKYYVEKNV
jgi:hypothetical protein